MACPYFYPVEPFDGEPWVRAPRLPLGDAYRGTCHAASDAVIEPDETTQRSLCNVGYGRVACPRFPLDTEADAVRFSVAPAGSDQTMLYVLEKDYAPLSHSSFECSDGNATGEFPTDVVRRQAAAFAYSYERRRTRL